MAVAVLGQAPFSSAEGISGKSSQVISLKPRRVKKSLAVVVRRKTSFMSFSLSSLKRLLLRSIPRPWPR